MFGANKSNSGSKPGVQATPATGFNNLVQGTVLEGTVKANSDFRIDGQFTGTLHCQARVIIGTTGQVQGDIYCQNAIVEGSLQGTLIVEDLLQIKETASLSGDIKTGKLMVQPGAIVDGTCKMAVHEKPLALGDAAPAKKLQAAH